jgi:DNA polymerase-3 subunit gamma/tau
VAEFMGGAGETLRALLMVQLGHEPDGLTEAMRLALQRYRDRLEPGDVLRMLRLLAESEGAIRRSTNPRLIVETLLLRWTMLDRIVDLAQVLGEGPRGESTERQPRASAAPPATPAARSAPVSAPADPPPAAIPAQLDAIRVAWPDLVREVRERSRFLGEALSHTTPAALELPWLTVVLAEPNALFVEVLQAQAQVVEEALRQSVGEAIRLRVTEAAPVGAAASAPRRKLSDTSIKADRLKDFRARDPSLDTAADALDLEIVD